MAQVSVLRVDLADFDQQVGHALYSAFALGPEQEGYSLKILGQYSGDAGEAFNRLAQVHRLTVLNDKIRSKCNSVMVMQIKTLKTEK